MGRPSYKGELRDILLTLLLLDHSSLGRYTLSEYLNLTKAKTRSVLETLTDQGLVQARRGRGGSTLSNLGKSIVEDIKQFCYLDWPKECVEVQQELIGREAETAVVMMNLGEIQTSGLYERDMAVRQGADGAITLINDNENWKFPNDEEQVKHLQIKKPKLVNKYSVLSISFGDTLGEVYAASAAIVIYHLQEELEACLKGYL